MNLPDTVTLVQDWLCSLKGIRYFWSTYVACKFRIHASSIWISLKLLHLY